MIILLKAEFKSSIQILTQQACTKNEGRHCSPLGRASTFDSYCGPRDPFGRSLSFQESGLFSVQKKRKEKHVTVVVVTKQTIKSLPHNVDTYPPLTWYLFISITRSNITAVSVQKTVQSSSSPTGFKPNLRETRRTDRTKN